jgi:hypothetical protein
VYGFATTHVGILNDSDTSGILNALRAGAGR